MPADRQSPEAVIEFNPLAAEMTVDPYPHYRRLRETAPVYFSPMGFWILTGHGDVTAFFSNRTLEHRYSITQTARCGPGVVDEAYYELFQHMVFILDGPTHTRIRRLLSSTFTPRRVMALRNRTVDIADKLIREFAASGRAELVADFARPFPIEVIGELMGVPEADRQRVGTLSESLNPALEFLPMSGETLAAVNSAVGELDSYFTYLITAKRAEPADDLLSALVHSSNVDGAMSPIELVANAILMYLAGHETTAGAVSLAVLALHRNPDQLGLLKATPALRGGAVEELLRYDSPGQATARIATEPISLSGTDIKAGDMLVAYIAAANRDPAVFAEPDRLDIARSIERQSSFGGGAHLCLGHALARQELEVALERLLLHLPDMRLDTLDPPFRPTALMRGVASLGASW